MNHILVVNNTQLLAVPQPVDLVKGPWLLGYGLYEIQSFMPYSQNQLFKTSKLRQHNPIYSRHKKTNALHTSVRWITITIQLGTEK